MTELSQEPDMDTDVISSSYIFTTNLCGNNSQTWFKDKDAEAWQPGDVIKAPTVLMRQSRIKPWVMLTLAYTLKHSSPVCLLNGFLGTFAHCKFSPDSLSLINHHCTLETKAHKVECTWTQSLALFCKLALECVPRTCSRKDRNQRAEPKHADVKVCFSLCFDVLPNIIGRPRII